MREIDIMELAQKLYNDDGHAGNVYKAPVKILRLYEDKAIAILEQVEDEMILAKGVRT